MSSAQESHNKRSTDRAPEFLLVTGMSGAGRGTAANMLEDLGWFVVDNLPPEMLLPLAELTAKGAGAIPKVAVVVDVRSGELFRTLQDALERVRDAGIKLRTLFLDASDASLVRRFESVRRPHPLQGDDRIITGIHAERAILEDLRGSVDLVLDTTDLNVHQLSARISEVFSSEEQSALRIHIMSFGFKYGIPVDADHVVDVRFLPNPYWVPELKGHNGTEKMVQDYVMGRPGAQTFLDRYVGMIEPVIEGYQRERRPFVTFAVGCTGGKHRSVTIATKLGEVLSMPGIALRVSHRDLGRE